MAGIAMRGLFGITVTVPSLVNPFCDSGVAGVDRLPDILSDDRPQRSDHADREDGRRHRTQNVKGEVQSQKHARPTGERGQRDRQPRGPPRARPKHHAPRNGPHRAGVIAREATLRPVGDQGMAKPDHERARVRKHQSEDIVEAQRQKHGEHNIQERAPLARPTKQAIQGKQRHKHHDQIVGSNLCERQMEPGQIDRCIEGQEQALIDRLKVHDGLPRAIFMRALPAPKTAISPGTSTSAQMILLRLLCTQAMLPKK